MKALINPTLYLGTDNLPDVCVLIEKAISCVGHDTAYGWYDHFAANCQAWPDRGDDHGQGQRVREGEDYSRGHSSSSSSMDIDTRQSSHSNSSSRPIHRSNGSSLPGRKRDRDPPALDSTVETDTAELRVRFGHAMRSLERSGIVRRRTGGSVVTRQIFTWISSDE